jgi:hypothetical protein
MGGRLGLRDSDRVLAGSSRYAAVGRRRPHHVATTWPFSWRIFPAGYRRRSAILKQPSKTIRIPPEMRVNFGNALSQVPGRMPDAIAQYEAAVKINPDLPEAIPHLEAGVRIKPDPEIQRILDQLPAARGR